MEMKKLSKEEVKGLFGKRCVKKFSNFDEILNGRNFVADESVTRINYFSSEDEIYDLGNNYYLILNPQSYHKSVNQLLKDKKLFDYTKEMNFEFTTTILKMVD